MMAAARQPKEASHLPHADDQQPGAPGGSRAGHAHRPALDRGRARALVGLGPAALPRRALQRPAGPAARTPGRRRGLPRPTPGISGERPLN